MLVNGCCVRPVFNPYWYLVLLLDPVERGWTVDVNMEERECLIPVRVRLWDSKWILLQNMPCETLVGIVER